jgi:hypothetical protein
VRIVELFEDAGSEWLDAIDKCFSVESAHALLDKALEKYGPVPKRQLEAHQVNGKETEASEIRAEARGPLTTEMLVAFIEARKDFRRIHPNHPTNVVFEYSGGGNAIVPKRASEKECHRALKRLGDLLGTELNVVDGKVRTNGLRVG